MALPAWLGYLLMTGGVLGAEQLIRALGKKPEEALKGYRAKEAYSKKRAMGMLVEQESLRGKRGEISRKLGDDETFDIIEQALMLADQNPRGGALAGEAMAMGESGAEMGDPRQVEAALAMASGDEGFADRVRWGSRMPVPPLLELMGADVGA